MKTVTRVYQVYEYDELNEAAQTKAINNEIEFIITFTDFGEINKNSNLYKAYRESERMLTPWFLGSYIWELCRKMVLENLRSYDYLVDGSIFV